MAYLDSIESEVTLPTRNKVIQTLLIRSLILCLICSKSRGKVYVRLLTIKISISLFIKVIPH